MSNLIHFHSYDDLTEFARGDRMANLLADHVPVPELVRNYIPKRGSAEAPAAARRLRELHELRKARANYPMQEAMRKKDLEAQARVNHVEKINQQDKDRMRRAWSNSDKDNRKKHRRVVIGTGVAGAGFTGLGYADGRREGWKRAKGQKY